MFIFDRPHWSQVLSLRIILCTLGVLYVVSKSHNNLSTHSFASFLPFYKQFEDEKQVMKHKRVYHGAVNKSKSEQQFLVLASRFYNRHWLSSLTQGGQLITFLQMVRLNTKEVENSIHCKQLQLITSKSLQRNIGLDHALLTFIMWLQ